MKVYFISGLGADERVFQRLELPGIEQVHLGWISPTKKKSLKDMQEEWQKEFKSPILLLLDFHLAAWSHRDFKNNPC
jgi:hypothetical protein